ncbi:hypothetical protein [Microcella sp.]|uniref:hypothetical protein n=1 Tax=Microcella sp. TaxID=1913979 RepID=UPI00299F5787|nr:hypothetical protein [Microcella sp.]MDX2026824.1 hypothetical protein [Microcella sp.]
MSRVPWFLIVGLVLLPLVFVFPLFDGYGRQSSPSISRAAGLQALVLGAVIGAFIAEAMIRGYQLLLARSLAKAALTLRADSLALLVLPESHSQPPPFAELQQGQRAWRVWPRGYPRVLVVSPEAVVVRSTRQHLASLDSASVTNVLLVNMPGRKQLFFRLKREPATHDGIAVDPFLDFLWIDIRSGLRPVSHPGRREEIRASLERVLQSPRSGAAT